MNMERRDNFEIELGTSMGGSVAAGSCAFLKSPTSNPAGSELVVDHSVLSMLRGYKLSTAFMRVGLKSLVNRIGTSSDGPTNGPCPCCFHASKIGETNPGHRTAKM